MGVQILDSLCDDEHIDCSNLLASITGSLVSVLHFIISVLDESLSLRFWCNLNFIWYLIKCCIDCWKFSNHLMNGKTYNKIHHCFIYIMCIEHIWTIGLKIIKVLFYSCWNCRLDPLSWDPNPFSNSWKFCSGSNCCFNSSRVEYYLEYEPHPSSTKNLRHLFQSMYLLKIFSFWKIYTQYLTLFANET